MMSIEGLLEECEKSFKSRNFERLEFFCEEALEQDGDNVIALNYKAFFESFYHSNYYLSLSILGHVHDLDSNDYHSYNIEAFAHMKEKRYEEALESCEKGLKIKDYYWLRRNRVESLIGLDRVGEAFDFYMEREIPNYSFVKALINCERYSLISEYAENISDEELIGLFLKRCEYLLWGGYYGLKGRYAERIRICDEIFKIDKGNEFALEHKLASLGQFGRNEEILELSDYSMNLYPNNPRFCFFKAETLLWVFKDNDGAIKYFEKGFALVENRKKYRRQFEAYIYALYDKARYINHDEAMRIYNKILSYDPEYYPCYHSAVLIAIDSIANKRKEDFELIESYKDYFKSEIELEKKFKGLDDFLKSIEIGDYDEGFLKGCVEFRDYDSFDDYVRDVIICIMISYPEYDEEMAKIRVKYSINYVKTSFGYEGSPYDCAIVIGHRLTEIKE